MDLADSTKIADPCTSQEGPVERPATARPTPAPSGRSGDKKQKIEKPATGKAARGRPKGVKDTKPRARRTKAEIGELRKDANFMSSIMGNKEDFEPGGKLAEPHTCRTVAQSLKGPDAERGRDVMDPEEARPLASDTWRPASDAEIATASSVIPMALALLRSGIVGERWLPMRP